jgi:hypothetical protein
VLCTVLAGSGASHVTEAELGTPISSLLPGLSGPGSGEGLQAVLCGGYHGTWLEPGRAAPAQACSRSCRRAAADCPALALRLSPEAGQPGDGR